MVCPSPKSKVCPLSSVRKCLANQRLDELAAPERLVGLGFRLWMEGYRSGDLSHWEVAWDLYERELGIGAARIVVNELSCWCRAVRATSRRDIEVSQRDCYHLCRDECLAVSMIAASQHKTCPAMHACAFALIESAMIDDVVDHSDSFAVTLRGVDHVLSPNSIVAAPLYEMAPPTEVRQ